MRRGSSKRRSRDGEHQRSLLNDENQQKVQAILDNLAQSSGDLSQALTEFSGVSRPSPGPPRTSRAFAEQLNPVVDAVEGTLGNLDTTLDALTSLVGPDRDLARRGRRGLAKRSGRARRGRAVHDRRIARHLAGPDGDHAFPARAVGTSGGRRANGHADEFAATGRVATERLTEAEEPSRPRRRPSTGLSNAGQHRQRRRSPSTGS